MFCDWGMLLGVKSLKYSRHSGPTEAGLSRYRSYISSTSHEFAPNASPSDAPDVDVFVVELTKPAYLSTYPPYSNGYNPVQANMNSESNQSPSQRIPLVIIAFLCDS